MKSRCSECSHGFDSHWSEVIEKNRWVRRSPGPCDCPGCDCRGYVDEVLPGPGERLVFGVHRLPAAARDFGMPGETVREAQYKRWLAGLPPEESA